MQMMQLMILQQGYEANRHVKKRTQSYLSPVDRLDSILEDNSCPAVTLDSMADLCVIGHRFGHMVVIAAGFNFEFAKTTTATKYS